MATLTRELPRARLGGRPHWQPIGWLGDRVVSRWGRRGRWKVAGTQASLIGPGLLALAGSKISLIGAYLLVQLSNNGAGAAYARAIPDVRPAKAHWLNQPGRAILLLPTGHNLGYRFIFAGGALWLVLETVMVNRLMGVR